MGTVRKRQITKPRAVMAFSVKPEAAGVRVLQSQRSENAVACGFGLNKCGSMMFRASFCDIGIYGTTGAVPLPVA